jgi:hypothetical protein
LLIPRFAASNLFLDLDAPATALVDHSRDTPLTAVWLVDEPVRGVLIETGWPLADEDSDAARVERVKSERRNA